MSKIKLKGFCSYSHVDEKHLKQLQKHLAPMRRLGLFDAWYDRKMLPGDDLDETILARLREADIILLLVSADFFDSNYCHETELKEALQQSAAGRAHVVPIMVRPVDFAGATFAKKLMLPPDAKAVSTWRNKDEAWTAVAKGVRALVENELRRREERQTATRTTQEAGGPTFPRERFGAEEVLLENFLRAYRRSAQAEAKSNLKAAYTILRSLVHEQGRYPSGFHEAQFTIPQRSRYLYFDGAGEPIGGDQLHDRPSVIARARHTFEQHGITPRVADTSFLLAAATAFDNEELLDVWTISDDHATPRHIQSGIGHRTPDDPSASAPNAILGISAPAGSLSTTDIIDIAAWDRARWLGVAYFVAIPGSGRGKEPPPVLGLAFADELEARRIFTTWREELGIEDKNELIRVSIIEGDAPGEGPGYTVVIGPNIDAFFKGAAKPADPSSLVFLASGYRIHRMRGKNSPHLVKFKEAFSRHGQYDLVPAVLDEQGPRPLSELRILKRSLALRHRADIQPPNDVDILVLTEEERRSRATR